MISEPVCCHPRMPIFKCVETMSRRHVDTLMVTDKNKRLYGVLYADSLIGYNGENKKAEDLMDTNITSVSPDSCIVDLLTKFDEKHISTLPVVNANGMLEGLITRSTLVNTLSRQFIPENKEEN